jgi:hypothetical protein
MALAASPTTQWNCWTAAQAQQAACAKAEGWPPGPGLYAGAGTPENNWYGYWVGDLYTDSETGKVYSFTGTPGTAVGWNAQS